MTRHYEHWPAHHHFFCRGRVMLGSNPGMLMVTLILLSGPFAVWMIFIALPLKQLPVLVTGSALLASTLYFLARAALTDPGILPRCTPPPAEELPEPPGHLLNADGSDLYYCDTCNLFRPPRTKHCRQCDACVSQFDHHCPWVGSCVGLRNYRFFFGFTACVTMLAGFLCASSVFRLKQKCEQLSALNAAENNHGQSVWTDYLREGINDVPESLCLALFTGLVCVSLLFLLFYHLSLLSKGETTNEQLRRTFQRHVNPYTRGFWTNLRVALWDAVPPSQIEFLTEEVTEGALPGMARSEAEMEARRRCNAPPAASSTQPAQPPQRTQGSSAADGINLPASISAAAAAIQSYSYQADLEGQTEHLLGDRSVQGQ